MVVVDDCSQVNKTLFWIPQQYAQKLVFVGRSDQPVSKDKMTSDSNEWTIGIFEDLMKKYPQVTSILKTQYLIKNSIVDQSPECTYDTEVVAAY